tara:strand:+ start:210 stop:434 length:225 start_codon:yes stop_codon:yes gene_type:complete
MKMSKDNRNLIATTLDVFDYLMERNSDIGTNISESYQLSTCIEEDGVIYLLRDDGNKACGMTEDYKIKITKLGE